MNSLGEVDSFSRRIHYFDLVFVVLASLKVDTTLDCSFGYFIAWLTGEASSLLPV